MRQTDPRLACLILAAGAGSRLGENKLLLPWRGLPLIMHVLRAAVQTPGLSSIAVVLGCRADAVRREIASRLEAAPSTPVRLVDNPHWRDGQSSSLRLGVETLATPADATPDGVLVMLGDQPRVRPDTLRLLVEAHAEAMLRDPRHPATAPTHAGRRGNPVILSRCLFPDILALRGDVGARAILARLGDRLLVVPVDDPGILQDVDTPEDYDALSKDA